jgi:hypothetical protein
MPAAKIHTAGIISKPRSEQAARVVPDVIAWLAERGIDTRVDSETAEYIGRTDALPRDQVAEDAQLLIVLGGDGTLLSAARAARGRDIPLFAVNLGNLGFLTAITVEKLHPQLELVLAGDYRVSRRRMLHTELWRAGKCAGAFESLNDIALAKAEIARIIDFEVHVDDHSMCVYKADGIIISHAHRIHRVLAVGRGSDRVADRGRAVHHSHLPAYADASPCDRAGRQDHWRDAAQRRHHLLDDRRTSRRNAFARRPDPVPPLGANGQPDSAAGVDVFRCPP